MTGGPVLVRGVGDVGSAVAHVLFRAGLAVAIHDVPAPAAPRRGMAFADVMFDGAATLAGVVARRADTTEALAALLDVGEVVPVTALPLDDVVRAVA